MTAAVNDHLCIGKGKSWRTSGILCAFAACSSNGESARHFGHSRSSNTINATGAPFGGRSSAGFWAEANEHRSNAAQKGTSFLIILFWMPRASGSYVKSRSREMQGGDLD